LLARKFAAKDGSRDTDLQTNGAQPVWSCRTSMSTEKTAIETTYQPTKSANDVRERSAAKAYPVAKGIPPRPRSRR
jgi:hypothetical protein